MARKLLETKGKITNLNRLNNSINGNPRFTLEIGNSILCTKSDYSYCYNVENLYNKQCEVIIKYYDTGISTRIESIEEA